MIPSRNFDNFPTFASAGTRVSPDNAKYAAGFVPDDTYPAFWANYFLHGATKGISDLNPVVKSLIDECNNVIIRSGQTPNAADNTQLYTAVRSFTKDRLTINSDTILTVNSDTVARITANSVITITLADSVMVGASLRVYNTTAYNQNLKARTPDGNNTTVTLLAGSQTTIEWDGAKWISGNAPAVGATYTQYPNQQPPKTVYPCSEWILLNFDGAFFRSSGGNAQAFNNQSSSQSESLPNITGSFYAGISSQGWINLQGASGSFRTGNPTTLLNIGGTYVQGSANTSNNININASRSNVAYGTTHNNNEEVAPKNYTVKIWKRIN